MKCKGFYFWLLLFAIIIFMVGMLWVGQLETSSGDTETLVESTSLPVLYYASYAAQEEQQVTWDVTNPQLKDSELYALSAVLIDGDSGRILYEKDGFTARPMASTTKIMTLIVALEQADPEELVTVSSYAAQMPDVQLGMKEGEQYRLGDLYYSLMLESHNDTAVAIAETVGGSVEGFADLMNQKAEELGLKSTYYITPNGLDASDDSGTHSTSAYDLARVLRYCILESTKREEFLEITGTREKSFSNLEGDRIFHVYNKNKYLDMNSDAISGKTGFTCDAGYCYVGAVENEGRTFIVALLGCGWPNNKDYKWSDMNKLISYGEEYYTEQTVITPEYETGSIPVECGIEAEQVSTYTEAELSLLLSDADSIEITLELPEVLLAPVQAKEKVGQLSVTLNGYPYASYPVYAGETIGRKDFMYWLQYTLVQYLF